MLLALTSSPVKPSKSPEGAARQSHQATAVLSVGQRWTFEGSVHESVGIDVSCEISDPSVLSLVGSETKYLHPEKMKAGAAGGDAARRVFTFEAMAKGSTTVTCHKLFRGKVEKTEVTKVTVK